MLRRALAIVLLASFGLVAAADARVAAGVADVSAGSRTCCCCALAEAPGAVLAKLCCSLGCGKQDTPPTPTSGDASKLVGLTASAVAAPVALGPANTNPLAVFLAAAERAELERPLVPIYVTNATFLI
jgi:hypothetical protein